MPDNPSPLSSIPSIFSPKARAEYLSKLNVEFGGRTIKSVAKGDLNTLHSASIGRFLQFCLEVVTTIWKNETLLSLLQESRETSFLLKIYKKLSTFDLTTEAPEGILFINTVPGRVHRQATELLVKSLRQSSKMHQIDLIGSEQMESADINIGKTLTRCFKTIADFAGISPKTKNRLMYFRQIFEQLGKITDAEGKNVVEQIQLVMKEKKEVYRDLSSLYHAQWLIETNTLSPKEGAELLHAIISLHAHELSQIEHLPTSLAIATAIRTLEGKSAKIENFFLSLTDTLRDQLSIYEVSTERLAEQFTDEVLQRPTHVTMVSAEYAGFAKVGGLAEAVQGLSVGMKKQHPGNTVRLICPLYEGGILPPNVRDKLESEAERREFHDSSGEVFHVRRLMWEGVECLFIEDPSFEIRGPQKSIYASTEGAGVLDRFARFSQLTADLIPQLDKTDVVHLHDWHTAGVALKFKKDHPHEWEEGKTPAFVFTFHNNGRGFQGRYYNEVYHYDGTMRGLVRAGIASESTNLFAQALETVDSATTVSRTFAIESQNIDTGEGVSYATRQAAEEGKFFGIVNGSNPESWNPSTDKLLLNWQDPETHEHVDLSFSPDSPTLLEQKHACKVQLCKWIAQTFPQVSFSPEKPIVTFIGRYDPSQKGLDKLDEAIQATLDAGGQFICMGAAEESGAPEILDRLQAKYAGKNVLIIRDRKENGRYFYQQGGEGRQGIGSVVRAATEFVLVPSSYEPCGLVQFEGWLFGSLAIGSRVGGLADTIIPLETSREKCNGFLFDRAGRRETSVGTVIHRALSFWRSLSATEKKGMISRVMTEAKQCSWTTAPYGHSPVEQYRFVYENARRVTQLRASAAQAEPGKRLDLLKLFRRVSSQKPSRKVNIAEEHYLQLYKKPTASFSKVEHAYFAMEPWLRAQAPSPYTVGVSFHEHQRYGAHVDPAKQSTHFEVPAPNATLTFVKILGQHPDQDKAYQMSKQPDGSWTLDLPGIGPGTKYQYVIDGRTKIDPYGRQTEPTELGQPPCSVVHDSEHYPWGDARWLAHRAQQAGTSTPTSIFEIYPTAWRKRDGGTLSYRELAPLLIDHCKKMGYTHVELMGLLDHPSESSWGYQVSSFFAPNRRMGSPDDLKFLIDQLHKENIGVVMDFIPLHFAIDDYALNQFDGTDQFQPSKSSLIFSLRHLFFHWGTKFFDYSKKPVRDFLISSAAFWIEEMHVDSLRVDAVHPILLSENPAAAQLFLKQLNAVIHARFPGVQTVAEDYSGRQAVTQPFHEGGLGFDMKWNIGWMKHALDFFAVPPHRRQEAYRRMISAIESDWSHKMIMAISHDEVKSEHRPLLNMTPGLSEQQALSNLRSFFGMMYSIPGKKLLFMGCDTGSEEYWESLIGKNVGVDDRARTEAKGKLSLVLHDLNELYKEPAFHDKDSNGRDIVWLEKQDPDSRVVAFRRTSADARQSFACVQNFTDTEASEFVITLRQKIPPGQPVPVLEAFNSEDVRYGGSGAKANITIIRDQAGAAIAYQIRVPPMTSLIIREP
jgi:1,4-alpha-glucan branching enzyme